MAIRRPRTILSPFPDGRCCNAGAATSIFFVATKVFSRQTRTKLFVATNICRDKTFVVTNTCLSRQNYVCRDKGFCRNKNIFYYDKRRFVLTMTKMILMAAPANGSVLSQQTRKVCLDKNDTYGSSCQWYTMAQDGIHFMMSKETSTKNINPLHIILLL